MYFPHVKQCGILVHRGNVRITLILRCVYETLVAMGKLEVSHISVCVCGGGGGGGGGGCTGAGLYLRASSLTNPSCNAPP